MVDLQYTSVFFTTNLTPLAFKIIQNFAPFLPSFGLSKFITIFTARIQSISSRRLNSKIGSGQVLCTEGTFFFVVRHIPQRMVWFVIYILTECLYFIPMPFKLSYFYRAGGETKKYNVCLPPQITCFILHFFTCIPIGSTSWRHCHQHHPLPLPLSPPRGGLSRSPESVLDLVLQPGCSRLPVDTS